MTVRAAHRMPARHRTYQPAMPLSLALSGETVVIQGIRGGRRLRCHLRDMGLNIGATIRVLKNDAYGPLIIAVKEDGRLAIGRGMAHHIAVTVSRP